MVLTRLFFFLSFSLCPLLRALFSSDSRPPQSLGHEALMKYQHAFTGRSFVSIDKAADLIVDLHGSHHVPFIPEDCGVLKAEFISGSQFSQ